MKYTEIDKNRIIILQKTCNLGALHQTSDGRTHRHTEIHTFFIWYPRVGREHNSPSGKKKKPDLATQCILWVKKLRGQLGCRYNTVGLAVSNRTLGVTGLRWALGFGWIFSGGLTLADSWKNCGIWWVSMRFDVWNQCLIHHNARVYFFLAPRWSV